MSYFKIVLNQRIWILNPSIYVFKLTWFVPAFNLFCDKSREQKYKLTFNLDATTRNDYMFFLINYNAKIIHGLNGNHF